MKALQGMLCRRPTNEYVRAELCSIMVKGFQNTGILQRVSGGVYKGL